MLTKRFILILGALTAITVAAAAGVHYVRWANTIRSVDSELAFPGFADKLAMAAKIRIIRADENDDGGFTLIPIGDRWGMIERGGYDARESAIRGTLIGLSDLVLREAKTKDPGRHEKLRLADITLKGSKASRVVIEDKDGAVLLDALFGKRVPSLSGSTPSLYMRYTGDPQTWLASGELEIRGGPLEWLSVLLVSIQRERIERSTMSSPGAPPLELYYNRRFQRFDIVDLPKNLAVKSRFQLLNVGMLPENLLLRDVRPAGDMKADPALGGAVWRTNDGLTVTLGLARDPAEGPDGRLWAMFDIDLATDAEEKVVKEANAMIKRTEGWAFWLGDVVMQKMRATRKSLTKPKAQG